MPAQQAVIDLSGSGQSQQTDPRSIKDGSKQRRTSRQYTPEETAAIAAAWVEHKPVLECKCSSAPDKRKAWLMFQEMAYTLAPSLQQDFPRLEQLKSKVTSINGLHQKAIESMDCSGGAGSDFIDTTAFKILEGSDLARDPLVRPQGLFDRTKPDGKFVVLLWQTYTLISAKVVLVERAGAMHKDLYEAEERAVQMMMAQVCWIAYCSLQENMLFRIACILLLVVQVVQRIQMILFTGLEFMTSAEQMRPFMQPGDMYDLRL